MEIRVPTLGESVTEATVGQWFKKVGDVVKVDEPLVELETDKVTLEVPAPSAGVIKSIAVEAGGTVGVGAVLGAIKADGKATPAPTGRPDQKTETAKAIGAGPEPVVPREAPTAVAAAAASAPKPAIAPAVAAPSGTAPSAAKILAEKGISAESVTGTGKDGRIIKSDVLFAKAEAPKPVAVRAPSALDDAAREERVRMSRLRQTIARRLKEAQDEAAMLTTFNEVDMAAVMGRGTRYKDLFEKKHGIKLGFMGFFVKAGVRRSRTSRQSTPRSTAPTSSTRTTTTSASRSAPRRAGRAGGARRRCAVACRDREADRRLAEGARDGKLTIEEMQGGTFTITNGGIYGSLMSTPILNPPQTGILGMHKIQERPVVVDGKIVIRPMMYLALSYDHRVVDGREAVTFLVRVKEVLEDPERLVLDL